MYKKLICLFSCGLVLVVYVEPSELSCCPIGLSFCILVSEIDAHTSIFFPLPTLGDEHRLWIFIALDSANIWAYCFISQNMMSLPYEKLLNIFLYGSFLSSSGQSFWLRIQRSRVRSPALPDFLSSSGSGTGSTQPREVKLRSYLNKKVAAPGSGNRD